MDIDYLRDLNAGRLEPGKDRGYNSPFAGPRVGPWLEADLWFTWERSRRREHGIPPVERYPAPAWIKGSPLAQSSH